MSETLWIKLTAGAESGAPLPWVRLDETGRETARGRDSADQLPDGLPRKAVVAADRLLWTRLAMPGGRVLRGQALAYALEDRLLDEPEAVHAVAGRVGPDGRAAVAVVARDWLRAAVAATKPSGVLAEPALLAADAEAWQLAWDEQPFLVTGEGAMQLVADEPAALELIGLALARARPRPARLVLHGGPDRPLPEPGRWSEILGIEVTPGPAYDWAAAARAAGGREADLLQGEFDRGPRLRLDGRAWRPVAGLAAALLLVNGVGWLAGLGLQAWEAQRIREANRALFVAAFPDTRMVVDPLPQMRRKVAELRHGAGEADSADFLPLLARAGEALPAEARSAAKEVRYESGRLALLLPTAGPATPRWDGAGLKSAQRPAEPGWVEWTLEARP